jgi:glycosyltransferase involved in cell wall biosynthesis
MIPDGTRTVSAIVPAYNEAARVGAVLEVLKSHPGLVEIILVDDGSTDGTWKVGREAGVTVIRHPTRRGKAQAMETGVAAAASAVVFFADADIKGLTHRIVDDIIEPVRRGETEMFIGMRNRTIYYTRMVLRFVPLLGGERALTRSLWYEVPPAFRRGFKIETALNYFASRDGRSFRFKIFSGLSQVIKERKYGYFRGKAARIDMYAQIILANLQLHLAPVRLFLIRQAEAETESAGTGPG